MGARQWVQARRKEVLGFVLLHGKKNGDGEGDAGKQEVDCTAKMSGHAS